MGEFLTNSEWKDLIKNLKKKLVLKQNDELKDIIISLCDGTDLMYAEHIRSLTGLPYEKCKDLEMKILKVLMSK